MQTRIICIDPESGRVEGPVKVLRDAGYEVMLAFSAEVGMALVRLFPPDIVLLHSELAGRLMPQIREASPASSVLLTGDEPPSAEELRYITSHPQPNRQINDIRNYH